MSRIIRETCIAGAVIDRVVKMSNRGNRKRSPKINPTTEAVRKNNDRVAERKLARLINANFYPGDLHVTLTYAELHSAEEQQRILKNFLRRMEREFKKVGKEFRYIHVTEYENHRPHHHVVMSYIDLNIIRKQWKEGHIKSSCLDMSRNYTQLANYLIKETAKTFRKADNAVKQRYSCSRNLERPIVVREELQKQELFDSPKSIKGYTIDEDSIKYYKHPFTGIEHLEYQMISNDPVPRLKQWRKGKAVTKDESFRRFEEIRQIDLGELFEWETI